MPLLERKLELWNAGLPFLVSNPKMGIALTWPAMYVSFWSVGCVSYVFWEMLYVGR